MYRYGIRHGRVPLPEIDSEISEALPITYADKTKASGVGVVLVLGGVELVDRIVVLPGPGDLGGWRIFERIGRCVWGKHPPPDATVGVLYVKGCGYSLRCKCTRCNLMDNHPLPCAEGSIVEGFFGHVGYRKSNCLRPSGLRRAGARLASRLRGYLSIVRGTIWRS